MWRVIAEGPEALADNSPAHMWGETANPANQWLKNAKGRQAHRDAVLRAGIQARLEVRRQFREAGYPVPGGLP